MYNRFIKSFDRNEAFIFSFEDRIPSDDIVRVIDAFVDSLDLSSFNFKVSTFQKGNKPYSPFHLLKLYLYGYHKNIRSSRKLEEQCISNIYFMWLIDGVTPNFRTISDFRKNNIDSMKLVFIKWNLFCKDKNILNNIQSQDGTKVKAVNSKDKNFTFSKLDDRIKNIKDHINDYLKQLYETDSTDLKNEISSSIEDLEKKLNLYNSYQEDMKNKGITQKSLTDPESKLMRDNGKFSVSYNNQVCVDADNHIVTDFLVTDEPADFNSMNEICNNIKDTYGFETLTNVTDKGYNSRTDMINCLEDGIIPEVTPDKDKDGFVLETDYEENDITEEIKNSTKKEDIKKCLRAGIIPTIYKDNISSIEIKDVYVYKEDETITENDMTEEQMRDKAMEEKIFVRDIENNKVFCPQGEILRPKSKHKVA